jgi:ABC-type branched-subunit amino acid transport system substrate-binding protein
MNAIARLLAPVLWIAASAGAAPPAAKSPIVIGQTYVKTGPLAALSAEPLVGIRALVESVNSAGGIKGRALELRQEDDAYDADKAAANELKIPLVAPYTGAAPAVKFTGNGIPVRISFDEEYGRIVNHLFTLGYTRIGFAHNDNPGARSAMESTRRFIEERGQKMTGSVAIAQDGSDAVAKAQELAAGRPTAVVLSATNAVAGKFIQAYRAAGAEARFYSFSFLNGQALYKSIGSDAAGVVVSQVVPYPWNAALPVISEYQAAMKNIGEKDFSYGSLEGYLNAKVLVEALRRAGPNPTPESVKKALEGFSSHNLGGIHVKYTPTQHTGLTFSELSMIRKDGGYSR